MIKNKLKGLKDKKIPFALMEFKGIGYNTAKGICKNVNIGLNRRLKDLKPDEEEALIHYLEKLMRRE